MSKKERKDPLTEFDKFACRISSDFEEGMLVWGFREKIRYLSIKHGVGLILEVLKTIVWTLSVMFISVTININKKKIRKRENTIFITSTYSTQRYKTLAHEFKARTVIVPRKVIELPKKQSILRIISLSDIIFTIPKMIKLIILVSTSKIPLTWKIVITTNIPRALMMYAAFYKLEIPNILVISEYSLIQYSAILGAMASGKNVLALQHGIIHDQHPQYAITARFNNRKTPLTNLFDKNYRKILEAHGFPQDKLIVCGDPRDRYNKKKIKDLRNKLSPNSFSMVVTYATQTHDLILNRTGEIHIYKNWVYKLSKNHPDVLFIIAFHPSEKQENTIYDELVNLPNVVLISSKTKFNTYDALGITDIVITKTSTIGLEAKELGLPVIILEHKKSLCTNNFKEFGIFIKNFNQLNKYISAIKNNREVLNSIRKKRDKQIDNSITELKKVIKCLKTAIRTKRS